MLFLKRRIRSNCKSFASAAKEWRPHAVDGTRQGRTLGMGVCYDWILNVPQRVRVKDIIAA